MALDYNTEWCSVQGEEQRPKDQTLGNVTQSGKWGRICFIFTVRSLSDRYGETRLELCRYAVQDR